MSSMRTYYFSRILVSFAFGLLFYLLNAPWWMAAFASVIAIAWFLYAPHSGRYQINPQFGATALRRDERTRIINDRAGRNAFAGLILAMGAIGLYAGASGMTQLPTSVLSILIGLGFLLYFASDFWFRRHA